jgi:phosphomannomutase
VIILPKINWLDLLSGTDIRGTAVETEINDVDLTPDAVRGIGYSFAEWLAEKKDKKISSLKIGVGHDSRISADRIKKSLFRGITARGSHVYNTGIASTPAMFMSTILDGHKYDGAIMITASHLPYDRNGFKFFTDLGGLEKEDVKTILNMALESEEKITSLDDSDQDNNLITKIDLISDYSSHIKSTIRKNLNAEVDQQKPLAGYNIIVDAGNGAGGFFADKILKDLGADISGSQFLEPDGKFPNHIPNPEDKTAVKSITKAVKKNNADLGIIFDTDVDRAAVVESNGRAINRNRLIALASVLVLEDNPGATIVTDSVTSVGLRKFIEDNLGGVHHRFKRGYKNVINEAKRLEAEGITVPLAIETSGHAAFKENYFLDDGAYMVAKVLIKMANLKAENGGGIGGLISELEETEISEEYRMAIKLDNFKKYGTNILENLKNYVEVKDNWELAPKNYQGVRVNCGGKDWFLLRQSLHDPVLVLNVECDSSEDLNSILNELQEFLSQYEHLCLKLLD